MANAKAGEQDGPAGSHHGLLRRFADYHPAVRALLEATPQHRIVRTDIADLPKLPTWHQGRVVLLGDAAHASTPNIGQGANQAIEDAWSLALRLRERQPLARIFKGYQRRRLPKTQWVIRVSRAVGWMDHVKHPWGVWLRNLMMRWTPDVMNRWMTDYVSRLRV